MMNEAEHLQWCKDRALKYIEKNDLDGALASMGSDVLKHPETEHHVSTNQLGFIQWVNGLLNTKEKMRDWIEGYN